jgi:uncharacterized iron-regulated membrane protein
LRLRSLLFWLHLSCGVVAGAVILIMSVTGVLLTYQRQITAWADTRGYQIEPASQRLSTDAIVAKVAESRPDLSPTAVVVRSEPTAPASLTIGAGRQLFVDPYTGAVLGEGNGQGVRAFFRVMVEWHRYVAASGASRPLGRAVTGASNLAFLFIVLSGLFLWWPRSWKWSTVRGITWFKGGLRGKARDFNWHNTIGFWSAIPLAIIVAGGVVISYPWATALVYRAYGEAPPAPAGAAARGGGPGGGGAGAGARGGGPGAGRLGVDAGARADRLHPARPQSDGVSLDTMIVAASTQMPEWKTISVALPASNAPRVVLTLDSGDGGQPQKRATLTLDRRTGETVRWEPFSSQSSGRRARTWLRFAHTGEVYGLPGQTFAGLVTAGSTVLVWTGLALALRRFVLWRKRSSSQVMSKAA